MDRREIKNLLRREVKTLRDNMSSKDKELLSKIITDKFLKEEILKKSKVIMSYMDFKNEVSTCYLHKKLIEMGKILVLPKVCGDNIVPIKYENEFIEGKFGIKEPLGEKFLEKIDIVIVPGIVFNRRGDRIGFGRGFYDRFLSKNKAVIKYSFGYDFQLRDNFSGEEFDIKIDKLITEKEILNF